MPLPSVEPMPPVRELSRLLLPLEAQDASYLAASDRMASFRLRLSWAISFPFRSCPETTPPPLPFQYQMTAPAHS